MRIVVRGIPAAQGSKRHVGGGIMVESSRAVGPWREAVRAETQRATLNGPQPGPFHVDLTFRLPRPKSLPKRERFPRRRPDLDKLIRAVFDGLTEGGAWADDGQATSLTARKVYANDEFPPGVVIYIEKEDGTR